MKQRRLTPFIIIVVLAASTIACGININIPTRAVEIGPMQTETDELHPPNPSETTEVSINFGAGELNIFPGSEDNLLTLNSTYNLDGLEPEISTSGNKVEISQGNLDYEFPGVRNLDDVENNWDLAIGTYPINLEIKAGAYVGEIDLGGLAIENLKVFGGASDVYLTFSEPNLTEMNTFYYSTAASNVELTNLANSNFTFMDFDAGAGNFTLDFSGDLQYDASIKITSALSNVTIIVPRGIPASITIEEGLSSISDFGDWRGSGNHYNQEGSGPSLTFQIELGAGSLTLDN
jgi:hypothetical protein